MSFKLNDNSGGNNDGLTQPILDAGPYPARIVGMVIWGMQNQPPFQGNPKPDRTEMYLVTEMSDEFMLDEDGNEVEDKPLWKSTSFPLYPMSTENAKCVKWYKALDPSNQFDGDWSEIFNLGNPINIILDKKDGHGKHAGKVFNNIIGLASMPAKRQKVVNPLIGEKFIFDFYEPDKETWDKLPDWIKTKCKEATDFKGSPLDIMLGGESVDEDQVEGEEESDEEVF